MEGHGGSSFNISELVLTGCGVAVAVEELGNWGFVLWEVWVFSALVPLLIVVDHVVGLWGEQLAQLLVLEDVVEDPDLIDGWLSTSVSDSGSSCEGEEEEMDFPNESLVEHEEAEGSVGNEGSSPAII